MPDVHQIGDLQVAQSMPFQRRSWLVQRIGWAMLLLLVLAALAGLLGEGGPLSEATATSADGGLGVEYARFGRYRAPATLKIHLGPQAVQGDEARVWVSRAYLEAVQIQNIVPEAESVEAGPGGMTYVFKLEEPGAPTTVTFNLQPLKRWWIAGAVRLDDGAVVAFNQFVYP